MSNTVIFHISGCSEYLTARKVLEMLKVALIVISKGPGLSYEVRNVFSNPKNVIVFEEKR